MALLGGHTVQDPEIKFGYAVTGVVDPARVLSNANARPGDVLILTKPIGTGVIGTATKFGRASQAIIDAAVASMVRLNRQAAEAVRAKPAGQVHACTDVTGFGLIGHAHHMARASQVTLEIEARKVPVFDGITGLVSENQSAGMATNLEHFGADVEVDGGVEPDRLALLYDPQTSGGLLLVGRSGLRRCVPGRIGGCGGARHTSRASRSGGAQANPCAAEAGRPARLPAPGLSRPLSNGIS